MDGTGADKPGADGMVGMTDQGSDTALITRAIQGDEVALQDVWHQHRRWVAAVLLAHMPKDAELDDLLQEVGVALVAKVSSVREAAAFRPWLRAVAMSIAKTAARRRKVRKNGFFKLVSFTGRADEDREEHSTSRGQALAEGRRLMDLSTELPEGYREPLLLKCVQGMSYREIGKVMGLPETTVETRIARARRMLRERATLAGLRGQDSAGGNAGERVTTSVHAGAALMGDQP